LLKYLAEEDKGRWTEEEQKRHESTDFHIRNIISSIEFVQSKIMPGKLSDDLAYYLTLAPFAFNHKNPDHQYNQHPAPDTTYHTPKSIKKRKQAAERRTFVRTSGEQIEFTSNAPQGWDHLPKLPQDRA